MNLKENFTNPKFLISSLFNLLVLLLPLYFRFDTEELFEFNKMILVYSFTVVISAVWVYRMILEKRIIIKRTIFDFALLLFFGSQLIATIFSIHPYTSIFGYYSRFHGGLLSTLSYIVLFYAFISNIQKKHLHSFFSSVFLSGLVVSLYGIFEHFGHSFSCVLAPGQKTFGVDCWVQDVQSRVFATFGQPNWLAAYALTILPLSFVASIQKKLSVKKRLFLSVTTYALFLVLLYTRSRSGFLGLVVSGVTFVGLYSLFIKKPVSNLQTKTHTPVLLSLIIAVVLTITVSGTPFTPAISSLINSSENTAEIEPTLEESPEADMVTNRLDIGGTDSGEIRKIVWTGAYKIWQRYPLIGSGVETFAYSYYQDRIKAHNLVSEWDFLYNKAHNELLNLLATTGAIGLLTYLFVYIVFAYAAIAVIKNKSQTFQERLISIALLSGSAGLFVSNFFGFSTVTVSLLQYLFFAITILLLKKSQSSKKVKNYSLNQGWQYFMLTIVMLFSLVLLSRIYNYWAADKAFANGSAYFDSGQYQLGLQEQLEAISRSPKEALFYDNLSDDYAKLAAHFANIGEATTATQIAQQAVISSNTALQLNSRHLNFYKTRARVFVTLSQLDESYIQEAAKTVEAALKLSPTDPKLYYTLAVIEHTTGNTQKAEELYLTAIELKPNYERPYLKLSELYEQQNEKEKAIEYLELILERINPNNSEIIEKIESLRGNSS